MIYDPAALRTAVENASARGCDALTLVPHFEAVTFWERVFVPTWWWGALAFFSPDLVNHPKFPGAIGIGGFFLMRRAALERVGDFGAIRADVLDDMRLAEILKASGARVVAEYAPALVSTRMYSNLGELWESSAKNLFAIMRFSLALTAAMLVWIFVVALLPPALAAASALMMALSPSAPPSTTSALGLSRPPARTASAAPASRAASARTAAISRSAGTRFAPPSMAF